MCKEFVRMTDNNVVSKIKTLIIVCIASMFMILDSIILWTSFVLFWSVGDVADVIYNVVSGYAVLTMIPWETAHVVFMIGCITTKLASEKKWLRISSILHIIIRFLPLMWALFWIVICLAGKSV